MQKQSQRIKAAAVRLNERVERGEHSSTTLRNATPAQTNVTANTDTAPDTKQKSEWHSAHVVTGVDRGEQRAVPRVDNLVVGRPKEVEPCSERRREELGIANCEL